jgi:CRISPR-associated protein Csb3
MSEVTPSITVDVDPTNPGQFFACCGLLELAHRLWPGSEGWFSNDNTAFNIAIPSNLMDCQPGCDSALRQIIESLAVCRLESSLGDYGLQRLGSLLSAEKQFLTAVDLAEKEQLQAAWRVESIFLGEPFNVAVNWWWDKISGITLLKTWAAKQLVIEIARPLQAAIRAMVIEDGNLKKILSLTSQCNGLPFYFDSDNQAQSRPRDYGVSVVNFKKAPTDRPFVELLTFIALQRFRPSRKVNTKSIQYAVWHQPLASSVASAVTSGCLELNSIDRFQFKMLYRTEYMKAFLQSDPISILVRN